MPEILVGNERNVQLRPGVEPWHLIVETEPNIRDEMVLNAGSVDINSVTVNVLDDRAIPLESGIRT
jgi:hypothetical protein